MDNLITKGKKILVGMSGGVDSTLTARLLLEEGYEVIGAAIVFSDETSTVGAEAACSELSIPLVIADRKKEFKENVIDAFAETYLSGGTPNPCILCNARVKMQTLYSLSVEMGCAAFATGHYCASVLLDNGRYAVRKGTDVKKDQSYMLAFMTQEQLSRFTAPLADKTKDDIKRLAGELGLSCASYKESQDICFISDNDYVRYIRENYRDCEQGDFTDKSGNVIGRHSGILSYTVGQRRGLDIALGYRAYVTDIDPIRNTVTLARAEDNRTDGFSVSGLCFQGVEPVNKAELYAEVKIRYSARPARVRVNIEGDRARVFFEEPSKIPAPGQAAVFYEDDTVLFSGIIERE